MRSHNAGYIPLTPAVDDFDDHHTRPLDHSEIDIVEGPRLDSLPRGSSRVVNFASGTLSIQLEGRRHTYSYAYGPKGLAGLKHNRYALFCAIFVSIGGLEFGYDQGVIANVLVMKDFLHRWPITPLQTGIMTAILELGALIGSILAGMYTDKYTRQLSILAACVVFCVGSAFQCFAQQLSHLFIGRAIGGVGIGALSMLAPLYMAEISPPEVRGSLMALEQFSIVLGVVLGFWVGFLTRNVVGSSSWRIPLGIQLIPGIVLAVGCYFLPPSPRLLVLRGKFGEAQESLARLRLTGPDDPLLQIELLEMRVEVALIQQNFELQDPSNSSDVKADLQSWKKLFEDKYRKRTFIGVLIMFFQQWSGINALLYYGPMLVHRMGMTNDVVALIVSGGIGVVQLVAVLPAILWIDKVGRRPLLRGGSIFMALSHLCIALLVMLFHSTWSDHPMSAWMGIVFMYIFTFAYGLSFGPIGWVLPSEVFPVSMRSKGVALSTASNWINNFFIGLLTPVIVNFSAPLAFLIFACACVGAYIWATNYVPETANVSLEEIDSLFRSSVGREETDLIHQIEQDVGLTDLLRELAN